MRYNRIFNAKFKSFVIFSAVCFFVQFSFADDALCSQCGTSTVCNCQTYCETSSDLSQIKVQKGCGNKYYSNDKYLQQPEFEPNWSSALYPNVGIAGQQYIRFKLEAGMSYRWTTYDELEDGTGGVEYNKVCTSDSECGTKMKCYGKTGDGKGRCMWPFDTELTLIDTKKSTKDCDTGTVIAFSRSGGNRNQSALEYKAPEDMDVILLVTNNKYNAANKTYDTCNDSRIGETTETTSLKWQRYVPSHCETCGDEDDYDFNKINNKVPDAAVKAPDWTPVSAYNYIDLPNYAPANATEKWLKPGSYVDFNVEEGKIYRWSTCKSILFDTQLTLFKPDGDSGCGNFLAFDDDSETSYLPQNPYDQAGNDYCPAGTKQSVLEWHANFTGKVRLLFNEYNCSQCSRDNNSNLHWTHCFRVQDDYVVVKDSQGHTVTNDLGNPVVQTDEGTGFPVVADSSTTSNEIVTLTYLYSFPLDWQRYDCNACHGTAVEKVADFCGYGKRNNSCVSNVCSSWDNYTSFCNEIDGSEVCGDTVSLQSGQYMTFALRRGSKYIFETPDRDDVVITVKAGESCENGTTLTQGVGQVAYFAETSAECFSDNKNPNNYSVLVTVLVSEPECDNADSNIKPINLKYSFYTDALIKVEKAENAADAKKRFRKVDVGDGTGVYNSYYEDTATRLRFIEAERVAGTWEEAVDICSKDVVLGGTSGALECPDPVCPSIPLCSGSPCYDLESNGPNTCIASNDRCPSPKCSTGYAPYFDYQQTVGSETYDVCYSSSVSSGLCGKCISEYTAQCTSSIGSGSKQCCDRPKNSSGGCHSDNTCVSKESTDCREAGVGIDWVCPSGYSTPVSSSSEFCYNASAGTSIYSDPDEGTLVVDPLANSYTPEVQTPGTNGTSCPSGMHKTTVNGVEVCEYDNCGRNVFTDYADCSGDGHVTNINQCYSSISTMSVGTRVKCCTGSINAWTKSPVTGHGISNLTCGDHGYVEGHSGTTPIPCPEGWTYLNGSCLKCTDSSYSVPYAKNSNNFGCKRDCGNNYVIEHSGDMDIQACVWCNGGSGTLVNLGDRNFKCYKCGSDTLTTVSGEYQCKSSCSGGHLSGTTCYPRKAKENRCKDGWVQKGTYCKKVDTGLTYPICTSGTMTSVDSAHICNPAQANTQNCMCFTEGRCNIGERDKICPAKVCVINETPYSWTDPRCFGRETYTVVPGIDENDDIICTFTDLSSNDTCGKPSKGWTLPDINQLYSIVDFDLYNPATVFPFKTGTYNRVDIDKECSVDEQCFKDGSYYDGKYICVDGHCARNNWFWSSTTVLGKNENEGKFVWAVNMEDGRSYRVLKGCYDPNPDDENDECADFADAGLHATPYQVMCIKGSTFAALFHSGRPQNEQIFSGWACDKEKSENILDIYFEITDSNDKNISELVSSSLFVNIPGTTIKGIKYGPSDAVPVVDTDDYFKIKGNCNNITDKPYLFELDLNNPDGAVKTAIADLIKSVKGHGKPPYYVSAYAVDAGIDTASLIQPSKERFVIENECGDTYMTFDGNEDNRENCERSDFATKCTYTIPWSEDPLHQCQICNQETCRWTTVKVPGCGDSILQSKYCVKSGSEEVCENTEGEACEVLTGNTAVYAAGHENCEYFDFAANQLTSYTEQCDCGNAESATYLLTKNGDGTYSCGQALTEAKCPDTQYYDEGSGEKFCTICKQCAVYENTYRKPYCGDGEVQSNKEQCDDGDISNENDCLNNCTEARCGDGYIRKISENPENIEQCDAGDDLNGTYEGGCSSDCKTAYTCGDGVIQNKNCASKCSECNSLPDTDPKKEDCINTWCGDNCVVVSDAAEECDEGTFNGQPITYERFLNSLDNEWKNKCAANLNGKDYPISSLQTDFGDCLAKYKAFVGEHGCSSECKKSGVPVCGDGEIKDGEFCDDGYDTEKSKYNGKGYAGGCSLDCQFKYGCGSKESGGRDSNGTIDRPTCLPDMIAVPCNSGTPASTIGLEYSGEIINGITEYVSSKNVILFVNMAADNIEECDAGVLNGQYGICNSTCSGKPYCGDGDPATNNEACDEGLGDSGNRTIENAWSMDKDGTCIGVYVPTEGSDAGRNICTDTPDKWAMYDVGDKCCQYGRYCGDGIIDNSLDGIGSTDVNEWRSKEEKWDVNDPSMLDVYIDDINLAVGFITKQTCEGDECEYHDAELNIKIPIVEGYRYFLEYDVKVQKEGGDETPANMKSGVVMYDSDDNPIETCGDECYDFFFVDGGESPLAENTWINKKNGSAITTPIPDTTGNYWDEDTSYVKVYFRFKAAKWSKFLIRGLKIYTLESGKGAASGQGANEMCDNGTGNLDIEAAKADTSYMSGCTKYVNETDRKQDGCRWTNYCGDGRKHSFELCDNGDNKTNVYNGCEPGCTEVGPRCGDGILDIKPENVCPFTKRDEERCADENFGWDEECPYTLVDEEKCNKVSEKYNGNTYDNDGNFTGQPAVFTAEKCDFGGGNNDKFLGAAGTANKKIKEEYLDINNYGTCRTDCTPSRCGDGILDHVVRADSSGNPIMKEDGSYDYVEECDCGIVSSADLLLPIPAGDGEEPEYAINQKFGDVYICRDTATGKYYPNSNYSGKPGVSCRSNCTISRCGDGILDKDNGEECDDGNNDDHDDCTNNCKLKSSCGDGVFSFKRSYLCEELLDLELTAAPGVPSMKTMRDRGVVDCCISDEAQYSQCHSEGKPDCSTLVLDLKSSTDNPYGDFIDDKRALHYWFDRSVMHCCFDRKYETGNDDDKDSNCINQEHVLGDIKTLKDFAEFSCEEYQKNNIASGALVEPWEDCGNVSYSERCEFCNLANPTCGCDNSKLGLSGTNLEECLAECKKDPCGCVAYCEYRNSLKDPSDDDYVDLSECNGDKECIGRNLKDCVDACEERNAYCNNKCWNRNGKCGDGVVATGKNEACDNLEGSSGSYLDLDENPRNTSPDPNRGGRYCTGECKGNCESPDTKMCSEEETNDCWQEGCTVADHGTGELSKCGDGRKDAFAGEACDEGYGSGDDKNGYYGHCNKACSGMLARCGDGIVDVNYKDERYGENGYTTITTEVCDKGENNGKYVLNFEDSCDIDCNGKGRSGWCGDKTIQKQTAPDCKCDSEGANCKNPDGLDCKSGVAGAAEDCDPEDTRTKNLTDAGIGLDEICPSCERNGSCGDHTRNPRFEGCDCGNGNGSGPCTVTYGSEEVAFTCFEGCKADPIGKVTTYNAVDISGWACDPDHPMKHPAVVTEDGTTIDGFVRIEFYDKSGANIKTAYKQTDKDVSNSVVQACGGGKQHGFSYNPNLEGTGITDFATQNPIKVEVYVKSIDKAEDSTSSEHEWVKIGESTLEMGQQCGDGLVTKCAEIPIIPKTGSATLQDGWVCHSSGNPCSTALDPAKCIEVQGTCAQYGLVDDIACIDEKCDEGVNNGPTKPCSSGKKADGTTHSVLACDYNYCGDGIAQTDGNGKAFGDSTFGYNDNGYGDYTPKAFVEECDGNSTEQCNLVFNTPCTTNESTPFAGCVPDGATVTTDRTSCVTGTCMWKKTDKCTLTHVCPSLDSVVENNGWGWNKAGNSIYYTQGSTYTRSWDGSKWDPAAVTALKHSGAGSTSAENECAFECYNEGDTDGKAKLVWNASSKKCKKQDGYLPCPVCSDANGVNPNDTSKKCTETGWRTVDQTIDVNTETGVVILTPSDSEFINNYPTVHDGHIPSGKENGCAYTCKTSSDPMENTTYSCVGTDCGCKKNKVSTPCPALGLGEAWAVISGSNGNYTIKTSDDENRSITQTLTAGTGENATYEPSANKIFATVDNINDNGGDFNRCYFTCKPNYEWNLQSQQCEYHLACGDGVIQTPDCDNKTGRTGNVTLSFGGKSQSVSCKYVPEDQREACDDGDERDGGTRINGTYTSVEWGPTGDKVKVSACKSDCSGRIQMDTNPPRGEFFCGDGKVQKKNAIDNDTSCGTGVYQSSNCVKVDGNGEDNYPGPGWIGFDDSNFVGEVCDTEDTSTKNNRTKLCNMALGKTETPASGYYAQSGSYEPSCSNCSSIINASKTTGCNYCGDDYLAPDHENCESRGVDGVDGIRYGNANTDIFNYKTPITKDVTTYDSSYWVPVSGIYEIIAVGAKGGDGGRGGNASSVIWPCDGKSGGGGGTHAKGGTVKAYYYFAKGTTLKLYAGQEGTKGGDGSKNSSSDVTSGGAAGGSYDSTYNSGYSGGSGTKGNGQNGSNGGSGGKGGGGGGASVVKNGNTVLIVAHGGGGGGGGEGGGPCSSGSTGYSAGQPDDLPPCMGGQHSSYNGHSNNDNGGRGGEGGNGGRYSDTQCNYFASGYYSDSDFSAPSSTEADNDDAGSISIKLVKYAPCNACHFSTNTSDFIKLNEKKSACTGLIDHAEWNSVSHITQKPSGASWTPPLAASHNTNPSNTECRYKCKQGDNGKDYHYEGGACINTKPVACTDLESNTVWTTTNTTTKIITQTWSGSDAGGSWGPTTVGQYNTNTAENQCYYKCDSTHTRYDDGTGAKCVNSRSGQTCTGLIAHAHWWGEDEQYGTQKGHKITQTWTPSGGWESSLSGDYSATDPGSNKCYYHCNTNYHWNSSTKKCEPNTRRTVECKNRPGNTDWNDGRTGSEIGKIHQTWDETSSAGCTSSDWSSNNCWFPRTKDAVYQPTTAAECGYKCSANYHTENSGAKCISDYMTPSGTNPDGSTSECQPGDPGRCKCNDLPTGAVANTATAIARHWNGTKWLPENSYTGNYDDSASGTTAECHYKCRSDEWQHFVWNGSQCVGDKTYADCTGLPDHATWWANTETYGKKDGHEIEQTWTNTSGSNWDWRPILDGEHKEENPHDNGKCFFHCNKNYHWNSTTKKCDPDERTEVACTPAKPTKAGWNDGKTGDYIGKFEQTWKDWIDSSDCSQTQWTDGDCWFPRTKASNHSSTTAECNYQCNFNYTWNGSQPSPNCIADKMGSYCTVPSTLTAGTWEWNDEGKYYSGSNGVSGSVSGHGTFERVWDDSVFYPESYTATYSTTAGVCRYKCASGYHTEDGGKTCISNTRKSKACNAKKDHSSWNDSGSNPGNFTQTWNGGSDCGTADPETCWTPSSHSSSYNTTAGECNYKCNKNYDWKNNTCNNPKTRPKSCTGLDSSGLWWATGTETAPEITQTWNEDGETGDPCTPANDNCWYPRTTGTYSSTNGGGCTFHCYSSDREYSWNSNENRCNYCNDGDVSDGETCDKKKDYGTCYVQTANTTCKPSCTTYTQYNYDVYTQSCEDDCSNWKKIRKGTETENVCNDSTWPGSKCK